MPWAEALIESKTEAVEIADGQRVLAYSDALKEALDQALELDANVVVLGQGVNDPVGMFGVTTGLHKRHGKERVTDTPLSEDALTGVCVGAAMAGMRPVYLHNRPDFLLLTFNQLVNHASKIHYMDNGQSRVPMVVWSAIGRGWGSGAQHSQAIQGLLLGVPGLKVVMPSTPYDAKGLMLSAIADNNPVLIFEHRWLMKQKGVVPQELYKVPIGKGVYRRRGADLSVIGSSHTLALAMQALDKRPEIKADVVDLRTIKPLDKEIILESAAKTGKVLVVDTGWQIGGVCAEVAALIAENCPQKLKAPVVRLGLPDSPTPAGFTLEQFYYPDVERIGSAIDGLIQQ